MQQPLDMEPPSAKQFARDWLRTLDKLGLVPDFVPPGHAQAVRLWMRRVYAQVAASAGDASREYFVETQTELRQDLLGLLGQFSLNLSVR